MNSSIPLCTVTCCVQLYRMYSTIPWSLSSSAPLSLVPGPWWCCHQCPSLATCCLPSSGCGAESSRLPPALSARDGSRWSAGFPFLKGEGKRGSKQSIKKVQYIRNLYKKVQGIKFRSKVTLTVGKVYNFKKSLAQKS